MTQPDITDADRALLDAICGHIIDFNKPVKKERLALIAANRIATSQAADRAGYERGVRESAGVAKSHAICGCDGKHGRCNQDDLPLAIEEDILNLIPGGDDA